MKKTGHEGYSLHGLRKNATIELLDAGCTPDEVRAITGHITTQMIEKYGREVSKRRQAKAAIVKLTDVKKNKGWPKVSKKCQPLKEIAAQWPLSP